jgi:DNA-directed RNA polymerase specialized sigma24 family protein
MSAKLLTHADVTKTIARILRCAGVRAQDMGDGVADVQVRILHALRNRPQLLWPTTVEAWKALGIRATKSHLYDQWKKAKRRAELGDVGVVVENSDEHAAETRRLSERDPLDHEKGLKLLDEILTESKKGDLDARILDALLDDKDQAEIAAELGLSHQQVRDRVRVLRATFGAKVTAVLGAGALGLFLLLKGPTEPRYYALAPDTVFTEASPEEESADLRDMARQSCQASSWDRCIELLDEAARLDPAGDQAPAIQAVRDRVAQERNDELRQEEAKPHPAPTAPPKAPKGP